jgi:hypothetical protein
MEFSAMMAALQWMLVLRKWRSADEWRSRSPRLIARHSRVGAYATDRSSARHFPDMAGELIATQYWRGATTPLAP